MKVGDLVKLYGSTWLGVGVVTTLSPSTATVYFTSSESGIYVVDLVRQRLEVISESR